jgi:hypothetical protein
MILDKDYRSFSSSLCNFLHSPVTSSLLGPNGDDNDDDDDDDNNNNNYNYYYIVTNN